MSWRRPRQGKWGRGRRAAKRVESFDSYIYKVLKQVHPEKGIAQNAKRMLNHMVYELFWDVADTAKFICRELKKATVSSREIQTAVRLILPGELAKHAVSEGTKAVCKYTSSNGGWGGRGGRRGTTKSMRAGLQFPVGRIKRLLNDRLGMRIGSGAPVYLGAILEYLAAEILELSGNAATDNRRQRITARHISLAVAYDAELANLFQNKGGMLMPSPGGHLAKEVKKFAARQSGMSSSELSELLATETRDMLAPFLYTLCRNAVTMTEHARRKTVSGMDVMAALRLMGRSLFAQHEMQRDGKKQNTKIDPFKDDVFTDSEAQFAAIVNAEVRLAGRVFKTDLRFSKQAIFAFTEASVIYLGEIYESARQRARLPFTTEDVVVARCFDQSAAGASPWTNEEDRRVNPDNPDKSVTLGLIQQWTWNEERKKKSKALTKDATDEANAAFRDADLMSRLGSAMVDLTLGRMDDGRKAALLRAMNQAGM